MQYREDKYGNKISVLGFGCMRLTQKNGKIDINEANGLDVASTALCEQYTLIDKSQLIKKLGCIGKVDLIYIVELCKQNFPFTKQHGKE